MSEGGPRIEVQGLVKCFPARRELLARHAGEVRAVDGVSFAVGERETLALVGESGSGKTTTGRALLRLVEPTAGRTLYRRDGWSGPVDLSTLTESALRPLRKELQIVFQDPLASLNPRMTAGAAIAEPLRVHRIASEREVEGRVVDLLGQVGLGPETRASFPHELSGGQRQRVGIARALATGPRFVVLDEPVSALDVSVQVQILNLLKELQVELGLSYLLIAHDLSVVRYVADRVAVMYLGRIVETGTVDEIFEDARHPYTQALLRAMPHVDARNRAESAPLKGDPPSAIEIPAGCRFHPRCPVAEARCREIDPAHVTLSETHRAACLLVHEAPKLA